MNGHTYAVPDRHHAAAADAAALGRLQDGVPVALTAEGAGFPGTEGAFNGSSDLVGANTIVFVPDTDDNLATHERFPTGVQIRMEVTTALLSTDGRALDARVLACTTVGEDELGPEVISSRRRRTRRSHPRRLTSTSIR